jgi:hypothetical protein
VSADRLRQTRAEIVRLARRGLDWVTFSTQVTDALRQALPFDRSCWHTVDPGTVLFTGSLNQNVACSGSWLAEHEYVVEDVIKWWFLARTDRRSGPLGRVANLQEQARIRASAARRRAGEDVSRQGRRSRPARARPSWSTLRARGRARRARASATAARSRRGTAPASLASHPNPSSTSTP